MWKGPPNILTQVVDEMFCRTLDYWAPAGPLPASARTFSCRGGRGPTSTHIKVKVGLCDMY